MKIEDFAEEQENFFCDNWPDKTRHLKLTMNLLENVFFSFFNWVIEKTNQ